MKLNLLVRLVHVATKSTPMSIEESALVRDLLPIAPISGNKFNAWDSTQLPAELSPQQPTFVSNANATLLSHSSLSKNVRSTLGAIRALRAKPDRAQIRLDRIEHLKRRASLAESLRLIAERELLSAKRAAIKLSDEVVLAQKSRKSTESEAAETIARLEAELADALKRNAELVKKLNQILPIRASK